VVPFEEVPPAAIAEARGLLRRADDVREQHGGEHPVGLGAVPHAREELLDLVEDRVGVLPPGHVVLARQLDVPRPRDPPGHVAAALDLEGAVADAVQDEGRHADRRQDVPDVHLVVHLEERDVGARARAHPEEPRPPLANALVAGRAGPALVEADGAAPFLLAPLDELSTPLGRGAEGVVGRPRPPGVAPDGDQRARPHGMGRREERAHRPALGVPEERRPLGADGVHHRPDVVHPGLEVRQVGHAIREPGAPLVEEDQPREGRQPLEEPAARGLLPEDLEVRHPAGDEDEVPRRIAQHLVGDVDVAAPRVPRRRCHSLIP
jgi:hypothetical protein